MCIIQLQLPQDEKKDNGGSSTPLVGILKNGSNSSLGTITQTAQTKLTESASNGTIPKEIKEEDEPSTGGFYDLFLLFIFYIKFKN